jgi:asparagine synthase (glutamine-hydrolysing)
MTQPGYDWHRYRADLFVGQHRKNFARCNKVFLSHGVECRLPFLHPPLVEFALSVLPDVCYERRPVEKLLIRGAYEGTLPADVTSRPKQAFQDGLGLKKRIADEIASPKAAYQEAFRRRFVGATA